MKYNCQNRFEHHDEFSEERVCGGNNKVGVRKIAMVALPVGLLAAMGLAFLWCCPEVKCQTTMIGEHHAFWRQLAWNAVGIVAFCAPLLVGWTRWLRFAPVIGATWSAMLVAAYFCPRVNGSLFVLLGPIRLDVLGMLPFALAMCLAWIGHRFEFRAVRMFMIVGPSILLVQAAHISANMSRVEASFNGDPPTKELSWNDSPQAHALAQKMCVEAVKSSHWFPTNEAHLRTVPLPGRMTSAMPTSAALVFEKWFLVLHWVAFAFLGCCFARAWFATADQGKKAFLTVSGIGVFLDSCECLGLTPTSHMFMPLASYSETSAIMTWLIAGTLASIWLEQGAKALPCSQSVQKILKRRSDHEYRIF